MPRKTWFRFVPLAGVLLLLLPLPRTARAEWNLGTDVGLSYLSPEHGEGIGTLGLGAGAALAPFFQPGFRIGFTLGSLPHELTLTTGALLLNTESDSYHAIQAMAAYQHNFATTSTTRPFVDVGVGINTYGGGGIDLTVPVVGVGVGSRAMMTHGHGALRVEARFDWQDESKEQGEVLFPTSSIFSLRVGWELWN